MSRYRQVIRFKLFVMAVVFAALTRCTNPVGDGAESGRFTFAVADVGQGLAQFGIFGKRAVAWDVGGQYSAWRGAYVNLGSPRIESIIISHTESDHCGALQSIGASLDWSGEIVVSIYEDTAKLRESAAAWVNRITFKTCARGDTLRTLGPAVDIVCLWPPPGLDKTQFPKEWKNNHSLVFSVRHGNARALITSDIDSAAMTEIAAHSRRDLQAQILSVPHHGSAGSVNQLFFSYVGAEAAVISCSANNTYGHPAPRMIAELQHQVNKIMYTYIDGTVTFGSNRYYWNY
jgi:competence protein ComEC